MNEKVRPFGFAPKTKTGREIQIKPSIPPKDIVNPFFHFIPGANPAITMDTNSMDAIRFLFKKLDDFAVIRGPEYKKLPEDNPERICFEYRRWILAYLTSSTSNGRLNLKDFEERVKRWKHYDPEILQQAIYASINDLGIIM